MELIKMTTIIKNEAELKDMLISMMVQATRDSNSANKTFEEQAQYIFNQKTRQQDPHFKTIRPSQINEYLLTAKVKAYGSSTPMSLDKYIEDFHYGDTHSSTIDTEKEVITTHNLTTMMCKIFITLKYIDTYQIQY